MHIQKAINELVRDKTLVVIAHRLSTIRNADQILVIDKGKLVQRGTHDQLMEQGGQYGKLWERRMKARGWKISRGPAAESEPSLPWAITESAEPTPTRTG